MIICINGLSYHLPDGEMTLGRLGCYTHSTCRVPAPHGEDTCRLPGRHQGLHFAWPHPRGFLLWGESGWESSRLGPDCEVIELNGVRFALTRGVFRGAPRRPGVRACHALSRSSGWICTLPHGHCAQSVHIASSPHSIDRRIFALWGLPVTGSAR